MSNAPFTTDHVRTAIALAYTNREFIADMVLPRVPVPEEQFIWTLYNKEDRFTIPDTLVDRKGRLNQVEFGGSEQSSMTNDYGLEDVVPQRDIERARNVNFDPLGNATELLMELIMLQREQRVASLVHDAATYDNGMKETLAAGDKWDASTGKPIEQIMDAKLTPFMEPNTMVTNRQSLLALRRNPSVVKAYNGTSGDEGMVPLAWLEQTLELNIVVGKARYNSANPGQAMSLAELWGNHCALLYLNPSAAPSKGLTFGLTAQYETRIARTKSDDNVGLRGATVLQVGESVKELVMASDVAYFIEGTL